jgi:hypothetical protein
VPRHLGHLVLVFLVTGVLIWLGPQALAQVPDVEIPDVEIPDVPDVPDVDVPDPDDVVRDVKDVIPDPGDVDVPDIDDVVPDPDVDGPDVPVVPDLPDADGNPNPDGGDKDRGGIAPAGRRRGSSPGGTAGRSASSLFDHLAAARAVDRTIAPAPIDRAPTAQADASGEGSLLAPLTFPLTLMFAVGLFLALQDYFDRRDPKLALGPIGARDRRLTFE